MAMRALALGLLISSTAFAQQEGAERKEGSATTLRKVIVFDFDEEVVECRFPKPVFEPEDFFTPHAPMKLIRMRDSFQDKAMGDLPGR